jgi:hypothetical protein
MITRERVILRERDMSRRIGGTGIIIRPRINIRPMARKRSLLLLAL